MKYALAEKRMQQQLFLFFGMVGKRITVKMNYMYMCTKNNNNNKKKQK